MRDIIECLKKYISATENEKFITHGKKLADRFLKGIEKSCQMNLTEPKIVEIVEQIINRIDKFSTRDSTLNISTNSIFIHGNKSQVEFKYYGKETQRELGDIIFILSVVYNGEKYFEKMTINQVKKANKASWSLSNNSSKEQLYLLSRFPTFKGTRNSIIPTKEYNLSNNSGCLGTHGLLYYPGDFAVVSSKLVDIILSNKSTLKLNDLLNYEIFNLFHNPCSCFLCDIDFEECLYILHKTIYRYEWPFICPNICNIPVLGNSCISYNTYDFADKYLRCYIGELIYAKNLSYNHTALQFLQDLLFAIKRKAEKERLNNILNFISSFYQYRYGSSQSGDGYGEFNYEGGGIGIIHTTVNLGESR